MYQKSVIKLIIVCAALAVHEIFFKPAYILYLESQGLMYNFGNALFGYMLVIGSAWLLAYFITRPMKKVTSG